MWGAGGTTLGVVGHSFGSDMLVSGSFPVSSCGPGLEAPLLG